MGSAFNTVGGRTVSRHIEGLIGVVRTVEGIGKEGLVFGIDVVVHAPEHRSIANLVIYRQAIVLVEIGLHEIQNGLPLAIGAGVDQRVGCWVGVNARAGV